MAAATDIGTKAETVAKLRQRASDLVPVLKGRAAYTEELRRIPEDTVSDLLTSGLYRIDALVMNLGGQQYGRVALGLEPDAPI